MEKEKRNKAIGIVAGVVGFIASAIGIFVFVTGKNLPDIIPIDVGAKLTAPISPTKRQNVFTTDDAKTTVAIPPTDPPTERQVSAKYPAGIDESLPRMVDDASLLNQTQVNMLNARAENLSKQYMMDLVIVTRRGIGGKSPMEYADDYFDYGGYGWRETATDDITTGSGMLLLVEMTERDIWISTKGKGMSVFPNYEIDQIIKAITPELSSGQYNAAFVHFLDEAESYLK